MNKPKDLETQGQVLEKKVKELNTLMVAVIIVLFIGFASMFVAVLSLVINADGSKQASYQQLITEIQRIKLDTK